MMITERFVYVHQPKTGGTFVTSVLFKLHGIPASPTAIGKATNTTFDTPFGQVTFRGPKHNACAEIPEEHRHKPVLATRRNIFDRYVSSYLFGWWKKEEYLPDYRDAIPDLEERYPGFPNISFDEYIDFVNYAELQNGDVGWQTAAFIRKYFHEPDRVLKELDDEYFRSGRYRSDMFDVRFVRTEALNEDLHAFLLEVGFPADAISFILEERKILPPAAEESVARSSDQSWPAFYSEALLERVTTIERHLLSIFPEYRSRA
jgi:hypothetical protein